MFFDGISIVEGSNIANLTVASGASFPAEPSLGELFFKISEGMHVYDGTTWSLVGTGSGSTYTAGTGIDITLDVISLVSGVVSAGTYPKVTVDTYGRVTTGTTLSASDVPSLDWGKITSGKPTTLAGYGITDAQSADADLTAIAGLSGTSGILKKTAADTWTLDTSTYLTANQSITLSGAVTGSGTTAITTTLADSGASAGTYKSVTVTAKGLVTGGTNPTTLAGYGITDAALLASPALTGTPTAPTATPGTNTTQIATTAFVTAAAGGDTAATPNTVAKRDGSGDLYAVNFVSTSDRRMKEDVQKVENGLALIEALEGVTFRWKNTPNKSIGVIAQDLEEVLPVLVFTNEDGQKSVNYDGIIGVLIEAVKELNAKIKMLEEK